VRFSPLDAQHRLLDAKMVPFGGWDMPLAYPSGTLAEHSACRTGAVIFDVSHLGTVRVEGVKAFEQLQSCLTNDLSRVSPGRAQYTHLLDESDASVLDDIIVWWVRDNVFDVMPNASNTDRVVAVQGPLARVTVAKFCPDAAAVKRFTVEEVQVCGFSCVVAGTGYTGEDGIEIAVPNEGAAVVWNTLQEAGAVPAGLGARDTLRLEAGLPLHGHELGGGITSLQAGLEWVVAWNKPDFRGKTALAAEKERGVARRLVGISIPGRRPARDGTRVLDSNGSEIGFISSGNFSPTLGHCVAMAFVDPATKVDDVVSLDVRGTLLEGTVVATPFVAKKK
jgi:aminomethyltransferase